MLVQLADAPKLELDLLSWSRHFRAMPGQGDLPVEAFMSAVRATGYDGFVSLEIFNDQFRAGSANAVAIDGRRSLVYLDDQVGRRIGAAGAAASPAASLPERSRSTGIEFIEFAVDEEAAPALGALIEALGFRRTAIHKSKDVDGVVAERRQPRHQRRARGFCPFVLHHARSVGLRALPAGRRCAGRDGPREGAARPALHPGRA